MNASKKRRGRPRKIAPNRENDSPSSKESNIHVADSKWTAVGSPYGLKIVLKKIDLRNSALVCLQNEVSPTSNKNLKILLPQLTLPRIDSTSTLSRIDSITEQNISLVTIDKRGGGQSLQQVYAYSESQSVICSPNMPPVFARNVYSMNAFLEDNSSSRQCSRKILRDVKNTSNNREIRKNTSIQPNLDGQENVPVVSSYDSALALPQLSVRLPQLSDRNVRQHNLAEKKFVESSTVNYIQDSIESHLQSLTVRGIDNGGLISSSSEMIVESVIQMNEIKGPLHLKDVELTNLEPVRPIRRGRKRKTARKSRREEPLEKMACRKNTRSSSIATRQKTAANHIVQLSETNSKEERDSSNFSKLSNEPQQTGVRVISTMKLCSFSVERKTNEKSKQQSFSFIGKRKLRDDDLSSGTSVYCAPKKRPYGKYNCDQVGSSSNGMSKCVVSIERIREMQQSPEAICTFQSHNSSGRRTHLSTSYVTRDKTSENKKSVEFLRIPWKKAKGIEKLSEELPKSGIGENSRPVKKLNEKSAKSDVKENCYSVKPKVKRKNVKAKKNSAQTNQVNPYLCYRTRQKTAQSFEPTEFYQLPWKQAKGFEVVLDKPKKVDTMSDFDADEPTFQGWPKEDVSVTFPTVPAVDAETSISKKGILKHNGMLASSTPFPKPGRRCANVSFASDNDGAEVDASSPVKSRRKTNSSDLVINGFPMRSCTVVLNCLPNPLPKSPDRSRKRMTRREARLKAESVNKSKKAFEVEAKSDRSNSNSPSKKSRRVKQSNRLVKNQMRFCHSSEHSSSSEEEKEILVNRNKQATPFVRLKKLNAADITSYKITPLKEDRIPKKSKTDDDYGIDDINTDDSTDDEEFPKKCIPQWVKDYNNQPRCQSYVNPDMIHGWMKPPQFQYSLRHVFFSMKSHNFM